MGRGQRQRRTSPEPSVPEGPERIEGHEEHVREERSTRPSDPFGVGANLKAPPLPPVPILVAIEILMSKYVFGIPFLILL